MDAPQIPEEKDAEDREIISMFDLLIESPRYIDGIELDVPDAEYRACAGVSQTLLKELQRSPLHYQSALTAVRTQTPAMRIGSLVHMAVFQSDLYFNSVVIAPVMDKRSKGYKDFAADHEDKQIISEDEDRQIAGIAASVRAHREVAPMLEGGFAEVSVGATCPATGVKCKGRFDWLNNHYCGGAIVDLKTTEDAAPDAFSRAIANYGYDLQAAHYLSLMRDLSYSRDQPESVVGVVNSPRFFFVVAEKQMPYAVAVYWLDMLDLLRANGIRNALLTRLAQCEASGDWPGYPEGVQTIALPNWARKAAGD